MRLVFVEGVSGVGKSTTTQKICDKLRQAGFSANRWLEFDFPNPIDFYCTAYFKQDEYARLLSEYSQYSGEIKKNTISAGDVRLVRYYNRKTPLFTEPLLDVLRNHEFCYRPIKPVPISEYTRVYKLVWEQFAKNEHPDFTLFDGSLFHHPINDLRLNYNATCEEIVCHLNILLETVAMLAPRIIYLSSDNVAERLQKARENRNETSPSAEQIQFWEERKRMDLAVMRQLSVPCEIYDVSQENWDSLIDDIVVFITENMK